MKNLYNILIIAAILIVVFGFCSCKGKEQPGVIDTSYQGVDSINVAQPDSVSQPKADTVYLPGKVVKVKDTLYLHDTLTMYYDRAKYNTMPDCPNPPLCKVDTLRGYYERRTNLANGD